MSTPDKFQANERVVRVLCPPPCPTENCPQHIPPGTYGTVLPCSPERMVWYVGEKNVVKQYTWRVQWDNDLGGWWTMEHCIESEESMTPGFPEGVWTE